MVDDAKAGNDQSMQEVNVKQAVLPINKDEATKKGIVTQHAEEMDECLGKRRPEHLAEAVCAATSAKAPRFNKQAAEQVGTAPRRGAPVMDGVIKEDELYIGRGWNKFSLPASKWSNPFKIGRDGDRQQVIQKFRNHLASNDLLWESLPELQHKVPRCHCEPGQPCHADVLVEAYQHRDKRRFVTPLTAKNFLRPRGSGM